MSLTKKICLYTCIILLIVSLYNDIRKESNQQPDTSPNIYVEDAIKSIRIKVSTGDTILSVTESINGEILNTMSMEDILNDFKQINPDQTTMTLTPGTYYHFPIY